MRSKSIIIFAALFLASGAALVVYILSGISLLFAFGVALFLVISVGAVVWRKASLGQRAYIGRAVKVGIAAGVLATVAYDLSRFALIKITGIEFWPFDIFGIFGEALFGSSAHGLWVPTAGFLYHLTNGVGFAIAYTIFLGPRAHIFTGIVWALMLEALMLTFYPGWLDIRAINEFLQVSIVGHLIYGIVLGYIAGVLFRRKPALN